MIKKNVMIQNPWSVIQTLRVVREATVHDRSLCIRGVTD